MNNTPIPVTETPIPKLILPKDCKHTEFHSTAHVARGEIDGKVTFQVSFGVACKQCCAPMSFIGAARGSGIIDRPSTDMLGITLRVPMIPTPDFYDEFVKKITTQTAEPISEEKPAHE